MKLRLPNLLNLMPWISIAVLAVLSWFFLLMRNDDMLFMHQMRSLFIDTPEFFLQCQSRPAGFLQWAGCFFTQLMYYPALGSSVLLLMWIAIFFVMKKALHISNAMSPLLLIPVVGLLMSEIDLGYWIYYHKNIGYCFSSTIGLLIASLFVFVCRYTASIPIKFCNIIVAVLSSALVVVLYPLLGFFAVAAGASLGVIMLLERKWVSGAIYILAAIASPFLYHRAYDTLRHDQLFTAGLPVFEAGNATNASLTTPIEIAIASLIVFAIIYKVEKYIKSQKVANVTSILLLIIITACSFNLLKDADYDDANYHAECKAYRAMDEQRWDDVLTAVQEVDGTVSRQLIMFKNIALLNKHDIGNSMYCYDEKGMIPTTRDSLKVNMVNTAAPIIYLHHGMTNYAYRWCMETQVDFGFNIAGLKIMAIAAIINGEGKLAEKYLNMLANTMFYKDWADHYMPLAHNPKLIKKYPELANINDLHSHIPNSSTNDEGICENFIIHHYSTSDCTASKYYQEVSLVYAIISKDIKRFWPRYLQYLQLHKGKKIPEVYQQVAYMFTDLEPQTAPDANANNLHYDEQRIIQRYAQFDQLTQSLLGSGLQEDAISRQTKTDFGDTFWWAYYFNHGAKCY